MCAEPRRFSRWAAGRDGAKCADGAPTGCRGPIRSGREYSGAAVHPARSGALRRGECGGERRTLTCRADAPGMPRARSVSRSRREQAERCRASTERARRRGRRGPASALAVLCQLRPRDRAAAAELRDRPCGSPAAPRGKVSPSCDGWVRVFLAAAPAGSVQRRRRPCWRCSQARTRRRTGARQI